MKSNNTKLKFVEHFKYLMLVPIILLAFAIVLGAIFGLNLDYDFKNVSTFNVKFNTTITKEEYSTFMDKVDKMCDEQFSDFRLEKVGEGAQNGILVKIANDGSLDTKIDEFKTNIENNLLTDVSDKITSAVTITTSETYNILPKNVSKLIGYSVLAIACIMLFVFIFYWVRYNFVASVSIVLTFVLEIVMLTSVMIVARIPFNYYFVVSYFVMIFSTIVISTYINNQIRKDLNNEKYNKYSNSDRVYDACRVTFKPIILFTSLLVLSLLAVMFFGDISLIFIVLSIIAGLVITLFSQYFFNLSVWSLYYKKEKDATLRRKIENQKKKEENKTDDKVVV